MTTVTIDALGRLLATPEARLAAGVKVIQCGVSSGRRVILPDQRRENGLDFQGARIVVWHEGQRVLWIEMLVGRLFAAYEDVEIGGEFLTPQARLEVTWAGQE